MQIHEQRYISQHHGRNAWIAREDIAQLLFLDSQVSELLRDLEQLLVGISMIQEITNRAKDNLVSFGERMATRIFAAYLRRSAETPNSSSSSLGILIMLRAPLLNLIRWLEVQVWAQGYAVRCLEGWLH